MKFRICSTLLLLLVCFKIFSQSPFTAGNIIVVRVGDGAAPLTISTAAVFLEEYTPTGSLVQTIPMPTSVSGANNRLSFMGNNQFLGILTLSPNERYLALAGFDAAPLTSNPDVNQPGVKRVIGLVDYNGVVNTSTGLIDASTGSTYPSSAVTSDGTKIWTCVEDAGLRYTTLGSSTSTQLVSVSSLRGIGIYGGNLYTGTSAGGIIRIGNGLPITGSPAPATIISSAFGGFTQNGYFMADINPAVAGYDVIYLAGPNGTFQKYSWSGVGAWTNRGKIGTPSDVYGNITGVVTGTTVTLYATRKVSDPLSNGQPSELVRLVDNTGQTGSINGMLPTSLVTSATNTGFRGVAMAPKPPIPVLTLHGLTPTSVNVDVFNHLEFPIDSFDYFLSTDPIPPVSGFFRGTAAYIKNDLNPGTHYYLHTRGLLSINRFSQVATIDFTTGWPPCTTPSSIDISSVLNNVNISWPPVFTAIKYEYAVTNQVTPAASGQFVTETNIPFAGLLSNTLYYFHIRSYCGGGDTSLWITKAFTTPCFKPSPFIVGNSKKLGTIELGWNKRGNVIKYEYAITEYEVPPPGSLNFTIDTVLQASELKPGGRYFFHIRGHCGPTSITQWSTLELNTSGLQVYPNPVSGIATVKIYGHGSNDISLFNSTGGLLKRIKLINNTAQIDMRQYASGVYFIKYDTDKVNVLRILKM
jgi:hypothetical protein